MATKISEEEYQAIQAARKANKNKRVEKILEVPALRYEGKSNSEIAEKTGFNKKYITTLLTKYKKLGLDEYKRVKQTSHRRNMTLEEEAEFLEECSRLADEGKILTVAELKAKYDEMLGMETAKSTIYRVLKRHGWRKIMPRSKHPKAASKEAQGASKKLTPDICE